jgi:hypothetical protein
MTSIDSVWLSYSVSDQNRLGDVRRVRHGALEVVHVRVEEGDAILAADPGGGIAIAGVMPG